MIELMSSKPNVVVRPQPQQKQIRQPQIIVIPQSMLANNGMKTIFSITSHDSTKQAELTRMPRPPVAIIKRPIEASKPIALKRPCSSPSNDYSSEDDCRSSCSGGEDSNAAKIRKRANLDHLSTEEKLMRRKLKNRVAAQNARDKKKVKMDEMEETIRLLEQKNRALTKQNEQLQAENQRLLAENETLKNNNTLTTIMIKDEQMPYSPESLPPQSHSPPLSDEDDEMLTSVIPIDMSKQTRSTVFGTAKSGLEACSSVSNRLLAPAEPNNVLQQQGQSRSQAVEQAPSSHQQVTVQEQLACLLWTCLLTHLVAPPPMEASQTEETCPSESSSSMSAETSLPPKKRGHWWGSHQPSPHAKT